MAGESPGAEHPSLPVALRRVDDSDDTFLLELYASTRTDEMANVPWPDADKQAFLEMQCRAQHADYTTRFPSADHSIVLLAGAPAGRVWIDRRPDEIRLLDIAIATEHRNAGLGAQLLHDLQAEASRTGLPLRHSVARDNNDAMRFYERLGFVVVEQWDMHDLMEWALDEGDLSRAGE